MAGANDLLKEIVEIGRDGAAFYDSAQQKVSNPRLRAVFGRMSGAKRELVTALSDHLSQIGERPPERGTLVGTLRKAYAGVLATLAADDEHIYVAQLEEAEDRLLERVQRAILEAKDTQVRVQLQAYLPKIRACHDEMRDLRSQLTT